MLILLKACARSLILPPSGLLILIIIGLVLGRRRRRLGSALVVTGVAALWLLSTPVVADRLAVLAERCPPLDLSRPVKAQAVVILGGGGTRFAPEYGGPAAEFATLDRVNYGAYVARRTNLPILITGAEEEALAMRAVLVRDLGVPPRWVENRSGDTFQNAQFSAPILRANGIHRIILVTSATHEWRSVQEFTAAGFDVVPAPVGSHAGRQTRPLDFIPGPGGLWTSHAALYELIGNEVRWVLATLHLRRQQPLADVSVQSPAT